MNVKDLSAVLLGCAAVSALGGCSTAPTHYAPSNRMLPVSVPTDYANPPSVRDQINKQDLLEVTVFKVPDLSKTVRVDDRGNITLPLVGSIRASGLSPSELESAIASRLARDYMHDPQVNVYVKEATRNRVTVAGSVHQSGIFPAAGETTLLQAIALAGGLDKLADQQNIYLFRKTGNRVQRYRVNLDAIMQGAAPDPVLMPDDRVVVLDSQGKVLMENLLGFIASRS